MMTRRSLTALSLFIICFVLIAAFVGFACAFDAGKSEQPRSPHEKDEIFFEMYASDGYRGEGDLSEKISIDTRGNWSIADINYGPVDEIVEDVFGSGVVEESEFKKFKDVVIRDAGKLRDDKSLETLCEMEEPDVLFLTYQYNIDRDTSALFDKCWIESNTDQELIRLTTELVENIYREADDPSPHWVTPPITEPTIPPVTSSYRFPSYKNTLYCYDFSWDSGHDN